MPSRGQSIEKQSRNFREAKMSIVLWTVWCCLIICCVPLSAQTDPLAQVNEGQQADDVSVRNAKGKNYSRSANVPVSRTLRSQFQRVNEAIADRDETLAANLLRDVLATDEKGFLKWNGAFRWSSSLAEELISKLSPAGRQSYLRRTKTASERALQAARDADDPVQLQEVAERYRLTPAGRTALREWRNLLYDRGELSRAEILSAYLDRRAARVDAENGATESKVIADIDSPGSGWTYKFNLPERAKEMIEDGIIDLFENGAVPYLKPQWIRTNHGIVVKTPTGLVSLEPTTGAEQWTDVSEDLVTEIILKEGTWGTNTEIIVKKMLLRRAFDETSNSTLSTDGERVYSVEQLVTKTDNSSLSIFVDAPKQNDDEKDRIDFPNNQLVCHHAETGQSTWTATQSNADLILFAGAPVISGNLLYVFSETSNQDESSLKIYDAPSQEMVRDVLATSSIFPLKKDRRRHQAASPLTLSPRFIYCPTGAGALVAIDRVFDTVAWVYRYPRNDSRHAGASLGQPDPDLEGYHWWLNWQKPQAIVQGNSLVFVSPESNSLMVLNRQSGTIEWEKSIPEGQSISFVNATKIVVAEQRAVTAYSLKNGEQLWSRRTPLIAGTGYVHEGTLTLPVLASGRVRLQLADGSIVFIEESSHKSIEENDSTIETMLEPFSPRNLSREGDYEWVFRLDRLEVRPVNDEPITRDPFANLAALIRDQNREDYCRSQEVPRDGVDDLAALLMSQIVNVARQSEWGDGRESFQNLVLRQLNETELQGVWFDKIITKAIQRQHWAQAMRLLADERNSALVGEMIPIPAEQRSCLRGRAFVGRLQQQLQSLNANERAHFDAEWSAMSLTDRNRLRSLGFHLTMESDDENAAANNSEAIKPKEPFSWPANPPRVTTNTFRIADGQLLSVGVNCQHGSLFDRIQVELDYPAGQAVRLASAEQSRPWYCYLPKTNRLLRYEQDLVRAWGLKEMLVMQFGSEVYGIRPFDDRGRSRASLIWPARRQSIDTLGDRPNQMLSFFREHPAKRPGFVDQQFWRLDQFLHRGTAVGPVHDEYFCIQQKGMLIAFNTKTGTELWRRFDLPQRALPLGNATQIALIENGQGTATIISALDGRVMGHQAVPFDRHDILLENGTNVIVAQNDERNFNEVDPALEKFQRIVEELGADSSDPEKTPTPEDKPESEEDISRPLNPLVLACHDVTTGDIPWQRKFGDGAVPFEIDQRWIGVFELDGTMLILDQQTGKTVAKHTVSPEEKVERIACVQMADSLLIAVSGPISDVQLKSARQWRSGTRRPMINGRLYSLSRETGTKNWDIDFPNTVLPIDQPRDLPIFVTAESRLKEKAKNNSAPESLLRVFDVRTGAEIFSKASQSNASVYYTVTPRSGELAIDVATKEIAVRFEYAAPEPSNALENNKSPSKGTNNVEME